MWRRRSHSAVVQDWLDYCDNHQSEVDEHTKPLELPYIISKSTEVGQFLTLIANTNALLWYDKLDFTPFSRLAYLCALRPGDVAFDIGAHHGVWSLMLERIVGRHGMVVAFEPFPVHAKVAELNFELNESAVRLYRCGIGEKNERRTVNIGSESISQEASGRGDNRVEIEICVLGDFIHYRPNLLKLDIEGAEVLVLPAIEPSLASVRSIFVEMHSQFFSNFVPIPEEAAKRMMDVIRRSFPHIWIEHPGVGWDAASDPQFIPTSHNCCLYASKVDLNAR